MAETLIVAPAGAETGPIEALCQEAEIRCKQVNTIQYAHDWITLRNFDLIFLHAAYSKEDRDALAEKAWKKNPYTYVTLIDFEHRSSPGSSDDRLSGFELANGEQAESIIAELIGRVRALKENEKDAARVMVVEDLDSPRDIICSYLDSLGICHAIGKASAREALSELEERPGEWACIITDVRMPEIDGKEFLEIVRNHDKLRHLPVIVLTAYGTVDTLVDCLKAGATGFMVKPPRKKDLVREVSRALRIQRDNRSPRLANRDEADLIRDLLMQRGID